MALKKFSIYSQEHPPVSYTGDDELFVHIGMHRIDVLVRNGLQNIPEALESYEKAEEMDWQETLKSILRESEILRRNFSERHFCFSFPDALVIPESKFSSSSTKDLLNLIYGEQPHSWIGYKKMPRSLEMMLAYRADDGIQQWISDRFPSYDTTHLYAETIQQLLSDVSANENLVAIDFDEKTFMLTLIKAGSLHLIQTFSYTTREDVLYDVLNCLQHAGMASKSCRLMISGQMTTQDELVEQFSSLFTSVEWQVVPAAGIFMQLKQQYPPHHFYLLQRWLL
ncbi:MAG: DUF3822 family protein [Bacteroidota bacterium]